METQSRGHEKQSEEENAIGGKDRKPSYHGDPLVPGGRASRLREGAYLRPPQANFGGDTCPFAGNTDGCAVCAGRSITVRPRGVMWRSGEPVHRGAYQNRIRFEDPKNDVITTFSTTERSVWMYTGIHQYVDKDIASTAISTLSTTNCCCSVAVGKFRPSLCALTIYLFMFVRSPVTDSCSQVVLQRHRQYPHSQAYLQQSTAVPGTRLGCCSSYLMRPGTKAGH